MMVEYSHSDYVKTLRVRKKSMQKAFRFPGWMPIEHTISHSDSFQTDIHGHFGPEFNELKFLPRFNMTKKLAKFAVNFRFWVFDSYDPGDFVFIISYGVCCSN